MKHLYVRLLKSKNAWQYKDRNGIQLGRFGGQLPICSTLWVPKDKILEYPLFRTVSAVIVHYVSKIVKGFEVSCVDVIATLEKNKDKIKSSGWSQLVHQQVCSHWLCVHGLEEWWAFYALMIWLERKMCLLWEGNSQTLNWKNRGKASIWEFILLAMERVKGSNWHQGRVFSLPPRWPLPLKIPTIGQYQQSCRETHPRMDLEGRPK